MNTQYGQCFDTIRGKNFLSIASMIIGCILLFFITNGSLTIISILAIACAIACFAFGISNLSRSIELYENAVVMKSLFQKNEIWRNQIELINFGKYDPNVYALERSNKSQLQIVAVGGTTYKIPYTAYKDLNPKLRSYQKKYNIPDQNS